MTALVFDLDGTVLQFTRDYGTVLSRAFETAGVVPDEEVLEAYESAFQERFSALDPTPVQSALSAIGVPDPGSVAMALHEIEIEASKPPRGARQDLERFGDTFSLGILTNGVRKWQMAKLAAHGLDDHFDTFVASYEAGAHKPAVAPFRLFEERLPADAYVMIGDDVTDVSGAREAGWTGYRYEGGAFGDLLEELPCEDGSS